MSSSVIQPVLALAAASRGSDGSALGAVGADAWGRFAALAGLVVTRTGVAYGAGTGNAALTVMPAAGVAGRWSAAASGIASASARSSSA